MLDKPNIPKRSTTVHYKLYNTRTLLFNQSMKDAFEGLRWLAPLLIILYHSVIICNMSLRMNLKF